VVGAYPYETVMCEDPCGSSRAHLGHVFPKCILKAGAYFSRMLEIFIGNSEKNILAFPSIEFQVPSK
jgi:hypothetical protein